MVSVADLSKAKGLPVKYLLSLGIEDSPNGVIIPYRKMDGSPCRGRFRTALRAKDGSIWDKGLGDIEPYGLWRLSESRKEKRLVIVEGETDCWTMWYHNFPCLGLPGSSMASKIKREHLAHIERLCIWVEPDRGGDGFLSGILGRVSELGLLCKTYAIRGEAKDPADLYLLEKDRFVKVMRYLIATATPVKPPPKKTKPVFVKGKGQIDDAKICRAQAVPLDTIVEPTRGFIKCPFHDDTKPSMWVKNGFGHCFVCSKTTGAIGYIMKTEGLSYREAVEALA